MEPYAAFSDDAILEGAAPQERSLERQTQATIPMKIQPDPTEELAPAEVPTEEPAPAEEPTEQVAPAEVSAKETDPAEVSAKEAAPTEEPTEEPTAPTTTISEPAEEPDIPHVWHEEKGKGEVPHSDFPDWTEVLHPAWLATSAGQTPSTLSELG